MSLHHEQRLLSDLSEICVGQNYNHSYCDVTVVCSDRSIRQNRSVIVVALPFLKQYFPILDINRENLTIFLPDFSVDYIKNEISRLFSKYLNNQQEKINNQVVDLDENISCNICNKIVKKVSYRSHMKTHLQKNFCCNICDKTFVRKSQLKAHEVSHRGSLPFKCSYCVKMFATNQGLKTHLLCHRGEPSYTCDVCNRSFYTNFKLKQHLEVHKGTKNFSCFKCDKKFSRKDNMKVHLEKMHKS